MIDILIPLTAIICTIGLPVYFFFRERMRKLELQQARDTASGPGSGELSKLKGQNQELQERIVNLETIVLNVDHELNQRILRVSEMQSRLLRPPAGVDDSTTGLLKELATAPSLSLPLERGDLLSDRYEIEGEVGRGGMGIVYRAHDRQLRETVALKVIAPHLSSDVDVAERFRREVGASRRVTHENVVRIHDLGQESGRLFYSMEWFPGRGLDRILRKEGALALSRARLILLAICDGLEAAHRAGVIHRDLKPGNVLLDDNGALKIIDFGLASAAGSAGLTATGLLMGTPSYMAPEQIRGQPQDERTDIYALGVIAYEALCGDVPFHGANPIALGFAHLSETPKPPRAHRPDLPEEAERFILRALSKDPMHRFPRARDLREQIEAAL